VAAEAAAEHRRHLIARCEPANLAAGLLDNAGSLHPEHRPPGPEESQNERAREGEPRRDVPGAGAIVGGTHSGGVDADEELIGLRFNVGDVLDVDDLGSAESAVDSSFHGVLQDELCFQAVLLIEQGMDQCGDPASPDVVILCGSPRTGVGSPCASVQSLDRRRQSSLPFVERPNPRDCETRRSPEHPALLDFGHGRHSQARKQPPGRGEQLRRQAPPGPGDQDAARRRALGDSRRPGRGRQDPPRASGSVHGAFVALSKAFGYAVKHRLITANPCTVIEKPRVPHVERRFFHPAEVAAIATAMDASSRTV
jgi:hypothetical protein